MIGRIRGELVEAAGGWVTVDVGGVGYEVAIPDSVWLQLPPVGEEVSLRIRQVFREDSVTLYGFINAWQRRLFDLLNEVKGCGPRIALALIGQLGEETVAGAIAGQDPKALARATGVGPRLAERIVLELKDKILEENLARLVDQASAPARAAVNGSTNDELVEALLALGYRRTEAEAAAREAKGQAGTVEEQIKVALRSLAR